jgi:multimeric flavodoxin WrbA
VSDLLAFVGSARRGGNTDLLVGEALRGARAAGATARRIRLAELDLRACDGCLGCADGACTRHEDDMAALYPALLAAPALLFATPVYFWNVSGLTKTLWDRMLPLAGLDLTRRPLQMRPRLRGVRAGTIVVQEEAAGDQPSICRLFFERNLADFGMQEVGSVYAYGALRRGEIRGDAGAMQAAFELGRALASAQDRA